MAKALAQILVPGVMWFHVPNGGLRNKIVAAKMKSMGVRAGVWDCYFAWQDSAGISRTGWIELKVGKNTLTDKQETFRDQVEALGHQHGVAHSVDGVLALLLSWGVPTKLV